MLPTDIHLSSLGSTLQQILPNYLKFSPETVMLGLNTALELLCDDKIFIEVFFCFKIFE